MMNSYANVTNCNAKVTSSITNGTNSTLKVTNSRDEVNYKGNKFN